MVFLFTKHSTINMTACVLCHFLEQIGQWSLELLQPNSFQFFLGRKQINLWSISPWSWPGATSMRRGSRCYGSDNESLPGVKKDSKRFEAFWKLFLQQNFKAWHFFFFLRRTWQCILKLLDFVCRRIRSPKSSIPMTSLDRKNDAWVPVGFPLPKKWPAKFWANSSRGFGF